MFPPSPCTIRQPPPSLTSPEPPDATFPSPNNPTPAPSQHLTPSTSSITDPSQRYSTLSRHRKHLTLLLVSLASTTSSLTAFIYFPALTQLASAFSVSIDDVNLTITAYLAVAAIAPILAGDAADVLGRRPAYLVTLGIALAANAALGNAKKFGELVGWRVVQALGVSGIIPVGYGVISDIASPAERGTFVSIVSFSVTMAPTIGPILGGALAYAAGWPWIFWLLTILTGMALIPIVFFLPETSRSIVGNGSFLPPRHLRLPYQVWLMRRRNHNEEKSSEEGHGARESVNEPSGGDQGTTGREPPPYAGRVPNPLRSLRLVTRKDNAIVLLSLGLMYAVYTCLIASLSTLCIQIYLLNEWQAGLIYLPFGLGGTVSTFFSGALLDGAYRKARTKRGLSTDSVRGDDLDNFPIEQARLNVMWIPMLATALANVAYGWVLHFKLHLAFPLIIQFIIGLALQLEFSAFSTLLVDINHRSPSAANATTSIVRCALAAIAIAFLEDLIHAVGVGWTFTFMGSLCILVLGLFAIEYHNGLSWRQEAARREASHATES